MKTVRRSILSDDDGIWVWRTVSKRPFIQIKANGVVHTVWVPRSSPLAYHCCCTSFKQNRVPGSRLGGGVSPDTSITLWLVAGAVIQPISRTFRLHDFASRQCIGWSLAGCSYAGWLSGYPRTSSWLEHDHHLLLYVLLWNLINTLRMSMKCHGREEVRWGLEGTRGSLDGGYYVEFIEYISVVSSVGVALKGYIPLDQHRSKGGKGRYCNAIISRGSWILAK